MLAKGFGFGDIHLQQGWPWFFLSSWKPWPDACPAGIKDDGEGQTPCPLSSFSGAFSFQLRPPNNNNNNNNNDNNRQRGLRSACRYKIVQGLNPNRLLIIPLAPLCRVCHFFPGRICRKGWSIYLQIQEYEILKYIPYVIIIIIMMMMMMMIIKIINNNNNNNNNKSNQIFYW